MSSTYVTKLNYLEETKELIKQAIIDKGVDVSDTDTFRVYADKISEISGGGEEPTGEILYRFLDYDGKLLYTFTEEEKNALTELPAMTETHEGMHFVGWTWTLDELKAVNLGANVGALWDTDDGLTHLLITVKEPVEMQLYGNPNYQPQVEQYVDWGDGSAIEEFSTSYSSSFLYHYYEPGDYDLTFTYPDGTFNLFMFGWDGKKVYPYWNIDFKELRGVSSIAANYSSSYVKLIDHGLRKIAISEGTNGSFFGLKYCDVNFVANKLLINSNSYPSAYQKGPYPCYKYSNSNTSVSSNVFLDCLSLQSIKLPDSITTINPYAFYNCTSLQSIKLPENLTTIGNDVFYNCTSLQSIKLPENLTTIGGNAFSYCELIKEITLPDSITSLGSGYSNGNIFSYCSSLQNVKLPNSVTSLGSGIFKYCSSLKEISIPNTVTNIEGNAFEQCKSLVNVNIPEGITQIKNYTFSNCSSLQTITIPASVTDMNGSSIFNGCSTLIEYHMKPTTPPTLHSSAFSYGSTLPNTNAKIYVPYSEDHSVLAAYQSATNWSKYANYIVEEEV